MCWLRLIVIDGILREIEEDFWRHIVSIVYTFMLLADSQPVPDPSQNCEIFHGGRRRLTLVCGTRNVSRVAHNSHNLIK